MKAKFINEGKYWDQSSKYLAEYDDYWNELVPHQGEADTLQGEILRMMGRIMYDYYNNGFGNDKSIETEFLEEHSNLFKQYMRDPKTWDIFYDMYEEICFGNYNELWKRAEDKALYARQQYGGFSDEYEDEEKIEDYMEDINDFIKRNHWDVEGHMDDIMDGIIQYVRYTKDKLEPLSK